MDDAIIEPIFFGLAGWFGLSMVTMLFEFVSYYSLSEAWLGVVGRGYVTALPLPRLGDPELLDELPCSTRDTIIEVRGTTILFRPKSHALARRLPAWGAVSFDEQGRGRVRWAPCVRVAPWMLLVAVLGIAGMAVVLEGAWFGFLFALIFLIIVIWQQSDAMERFSDTVWPDIEALLQAELGPR